MEKQVFPSDPEQRNEEGWFATDDIDELVEYIDDRITEYGITIVEGTTEDGDCLGGDWYLRVKEVTPKGDAQVWWGELLATQVANPQLLTLNGRWRAPTIDATWMLFLDLKLWETMHTSRHSARGRLRDYAEELVRELYKGYTTDEAKWERAGGFRIAVAEWYLKYDNGNGKLRRRIKNARAKVKRVLAA